MSKQSFLEGLTPNSKAKLQQMPEDKFETLVTLFESLGAPKHIIEGMRELRAPAAEKKTGGTRYFLTTTMREEFNSAEQREHYIKEHLETLDFDDKIELLKSGTVTNDIEDGDTVTHTLEQTDVA